MWKVKVSRLGAQRTDVRMTLRQTKPHRESTFDFGLDRTALAITHIMAEASSSDSLLPMSSATSTFQGKVLSNISPLMQNKQESGSVIRWRSTSRMEKYRPPPTTVLPDTSVELAITSLTSSQKMLLV
ncbi:PREDICTED: uncharacterized protein LOC107341000 [Acropora digitifera]|uniref:uncharacterized protein LOC107341000 n=1 Tax=Acropora digitifera TaxID=70779 RepID=UPI000779FA61|nr:PREDICTED: uncharacterized protein LOC107341000 [Acropora digitifera]